MEKQIINFLENIKQNVELQNTCVKRAKQANGMVSIASRSGDAIKLKLGYINAQTNIVDKNCKRLIETQNNLTEILNEAIIEFKRLKNDNETR
jgi:hypothetical protein